jgi:hypothetical protein
MNKEDILNMANNKYGIYAFTANDLAKLINIIENLTKDECEEICYKTFDAITAAKRIRESKK